MARNTATVTFTLDSNVGRGDIVAALETAARNAGGGNVRDITVTALEPVREINVPAADFEAFQAWRRNTGRA